MTTTIPDGLPSLDKGAHSPNDGSACIMEYVSLLAGEQWSDGPTCTHPLIAGAARCVNDQGTQAERNRLLPLVPRLLTSNRTDDVSVGDAERYLMARVTQYAAQRGQFQVLAAMAGNPGGLFSTLCANESGTGRGIEFLTFLLDEYDVVAGGPADPPVITPEAQIAALGAIEGRCEPIPVL